MQFQNSIEKSTGINKTTRFPRYTWRDLVTRSNRANHARSTSETIVDKKHCIVDFVSTLLLDILVHFRHNTLLLFKAT